MGARHRAQFQSAVAHELISNFGVPATAGKRMDEFQSAVAHELISNYAQGDTDLFGSALRFKALSRMSSFPTRLLLHYR